MNININIYMQIHVRIFKIYIVCAYIYTYIINIQSTHIYIMYEIQHANKLHCIQRSHRKIKAVFAESQICHQEKCL